MTLTRRRFLKETVTGAAFLASGHLSLKALAGEPGGAHSGNRAGAQPASPVEARTSASVEVEPGRAIRPQSTNPVGAKFQGITITPKHVQYEEARQNYNSRFSIRPRYILFCRSEADVKEAVLWAKSQKMPVALRSGGHSYEAFSLVDDGIVIDVSPMANIAVDTKKRIATVESGVKLMSLYETLWDHRLVVPGGSCATVGVAGLALGGGFGLLARHMGLTCDNLQSLRMVTAAGEVIEANSTKNADLFWACRGGGGGNFGIVTQFSFKAHPISDVTIFRIKWNWAEAPEIIKAWQKWGPGADDRITSILTITSKTANALKCVGVFVGEQKEARSLIEPLVRVGHPTHVSLSTVPFIEAARRFSAFKKSKSEPHSNSPHSAGLPHSASLVSTHTPGANTLSPGPRSTSPDAELPFEAVHLQVHPRFKNTSDYVQEPLNDQAIKTIITHLSESPHDSSCVQFDGYGGAINRVPMGDTAFCHRGETKFCIHYQISWAHGSDDNGCIGWINKFRTAMQPFVSGNTYVNYCDRDVDDWARRCFGDNLNKLIAVKKKYDPDNFFQFPQSIPVQLQT